MRRQYDLEGRTAGSPQTAGFPSPEAFAGQPASECGTFFSSRFPPNATRRSVLRRLVAGFHRPAKRLIPSHSRKSSKCGCVRKVPTFGRRRVTGRAGVFRDGRTFTPAANRAVFSLPPPTSRRCPPGRFITPRRGRYDFSSRTAGSPPMKSAGFPSPSGARRGIARGSPHDFLRRL